MALTKDHSTGKFVESHGMSRTREYNIWANMIDRCNNENCKNYSRYGAIGIKVCKRWMDSFDNFIADIGLRPTRNHSIDRIDVRKGYSPENCRWATKKEQSRNRRNSRYIYIDGNKMQVDEYCERFNVSAHAIKNRIRRGWDNERIISTPVRGSKC